jgi:uracil-DNA glycosylase
MAYYFPFGQKLKPLVQEDCTPKKVFVLGVYASAVHARWKRDGQIICQALAVASEPRIFWDGDVDEARAIIEAVGMPRELGILEPAGKQLNGPSAKVLDENILAPLGFTRSEAWLCDCLPETRLNPSQVKALREKYEPLIEEHHLNPVTIPKRPNVFCDQARSAEITEELIQSEADLLVLLGDIPIAQYLKKVADVPYSTLGEYVELYGYGNPTPATIAGKTIRVLPLAHPRQIGALGAHSEKWCQAHREWEESLASK